MFDLTIRKTALVKPPRIVIYGDHKIGKSTFAAGCPAPIFIRTEDGADFLGVDAFPRSELFEHVMECIKFLRNESHNFKTLVVDSLDWMEKLIWKKVCAEKGWEQIGQGPYGAGYKLAIGLWQQFVDAVTDLNESRKMILVLISHAKITKFEDPERENYDRYDLDLHEKSAKLICEYVDIIGFAAEKVAVVTKQEGFSQVTKAKSTGQRVLNLTKRAAFEAGNRYGLPDQIELKWDALKAELSKVMAGKKGDLAEVNKDREEKRKAKGKGVTVAEAVEAPKEEDNIPY